MSLVAVVSPLPGDGLRRLAGLHEVRVHPEGSSLGGRGLADFVGDAEAVISLLTSKVDGEVFAACPRLRVVANCAMGFDNVDLTAARKAGVWVTNTPDVLTEATADLTWALLLAVTRHVVDGDRVMRSGQFTGWQLGYMLGTGLQGKTLGIIGMGRIGRAVARRALAFGMTVLYTDVAPVPGADREGCRFVAALEALLAAANVLSIHAPMTPATRGLLDAARLSMLPRGAFVINTARGGIVDEGALADLLEAGHLGGVGLDVHEREPLPNPRLAGRDDVVLLPHLGSATRETRAAMADLAVDNVIAVLAGRTPPTPVLDPRE